MGSVARLFEQGLYRIPWAVGSEPKMRPFIDELAAWRPGAKIKQDRVMALWLADLCGRGVISYRPGLPTQNPDVPGWVRRTSGQVPVWAKRHLTTSSLGGR